MSQIKSKDEMIKKVINYSKDLNTDRILLQIEKHNENVMNDKITFYWKGKKYNWLILTFQLSWFILLLIKSFIFFRSFNMSNVIQFPTLKSGVSVDSEDSFYISISYL